MKKITIIAFTLIFISLPALAASTITENNERELEIYNSVNCNACDAPNLALDDTKLGKELKEIVENKVMAGFSNEIIIKQLTSQYGDFISKKNDQLNLHMILWASIIISTIAGLLLAIYYIKTSQKKLSKKTNAIFYAGEESGITDILDSINK